jgi:outer membrane protein OmpA-like peptidoglycan-associated protein
MTNPTRILFLPLGALPLIATVLVAACATTTPVELTNARTAYARASAGPAAQLAPADLHKAKSILDQAEQTLAYEKDMQKTIDLAYIAERSAQIAEAHAATAIAEKSTSKATQDLGTKQGEIAKQTQSDLKLTRAQLADSERGQAQQAQQTGVEHAARQEAEHKAAASEQKAALSEQRAAASDVKADEANAALAKLAAKEDERGMVITLSGSVLFRSNATDLLPGASERLDQIAAALIAKKQNVVVEGYTDSRGSQSTNLNLSQRRADSVRVYLVSHGVPNETIVAYGRGPDRPIAENNTAEGRANNRRVEIVIAKSPGRIN